MPELEPIIGICPTCQEPQTIRRGSFANLPEGLLESNEEADEANAYIMAEHDFMRIGSRCEGSGQTPQTLVG